MSRSYRKYLKNSKELIVRWCCSVKAGTMKKWKRQYNRNIRRITKNKIKTDDIDLPLGPNWVKNGNMWSSPADGTSLIVVENWKDKVK